MISAFFSCTLSLELKGFQFLTQQKGFDFLDLFIVSKSRWLRDGVNRIQVRATSRSHSLALLI